MPGGQQRPHEKLMPHHAAAASGSSFWPLFWPAWPDPLFCQRQPRVGGRRQRCGNRVKRRRGETAVAQTRIHGWASALFGPFLAGPQTPMKPKKFVSILDRQRNKVLVSMSGGSTEPEGLASVCVAVSDQRDLIKSCSRTIQTLATSSPSAHPVHRAQSP